jgi:hypothetical protein
MNNHLDAYSILARGFWCCENKPKEGKLLLTGINASYNRTLYAPTTPFADLEGGFWEKKKEQFQAEIQRLSYIEELERIYNASQQSIDFMKNADDLTFSIGEQLNEIIQALELELPTRALVNSFSLSGNSLSMSMTTVTKEEAAKVLLQLKAIPYISDVQIGGIVESKDEATNRTQVAFSVSCTLQRYEEPAVEPGTEAEGTEVQ